MNEEPYMISIQRVLNGETEAFAELVGAYQASVLRMAHAITGDRAAAQDVAQDAFVAAFRNLARYDASRATFAAWLHAIVRNRARTVLRQRLSGTGNTAPDPDAPESADEDPLAGPAERLLQGERLGVLDTALASLPEAWRRAFTLTEIEELPYAEAAIREAVPIGTIRSRVHRARQLLQQTLSKHL